MRRATSSLACLMATVALAGPAWGYVRTTTSTGAPMFWNRTVMDITAYIGDPPPALSAADVLQAATGAAATWSRRTLACTSLEMRITPSPEPSAPVGLDGTSNLTFRREQWCREPRSTDEPCYDPSALAVTSVFARRTDGEILDADIELNGNFTWGDLVGGPQHAEGAQDLQNTLTHEFGHFIGMDHTCSLSGERPGQVDDQGHAVPSCARANEGIRATTMFAAVIPGDIDRRTLTQDDMRAVCEVYPPIETELQGDSAGCAVGGRSPAGALLVLLALSAARLRRRGARRWPASRSSTDRRRRW